MNISMIKEISRIIYMHVNFFHSRILMAAPESIFVPQSLDTDVQRPFYSVATVALLPY